MKLLRSVLLIGLLTPVSAWCLTLTVNSNGDAGDGNIGDGLCQATGAPATCTLRAALQEGNAATEPVGIEFNLPVGARTIAPASLLPPITQITTIDGYTQPGALPNTETAIDNAVVLVVVDAQNIVGGTMNPNNDAVLTVDTYGVIIRGLRLVNGPNFRSGILVRHGIYDEISGNQIENFAIGILLQGPDVGGMQIGANGRNLINNNQVGVLIDSGSAAFINYIDGNFIGVDAIGNVAPNGVGIRIRHTDQIHIGTQSRNVFGYTTGGAIDIVGSSLARIVGNSIGVSYDGSYAFGTGEYGVRIRSQAGDPPATENFIAENVISTTGVGIDARGGRAGDDNEFWRNRFIEAGGAGAILLSDDLTAGDDPLDADTGPNGLQNYPEIVNVVPTPGGDQYDVSIRLESIPNTSFSFEISASDTCAESASGHRYGGEPLMETFGIPFFSTDDSGVLTGTFQVRAPTGVAFGLEATATRSGPPPVAGRPTSEFSPCFPLSSSGNEAGTLGFALAEFTVREGQEFASLRVTRENGTAGTVTIDYTTTDGTAVSGVGNDFEARTDTLTLADGQTEAFFQVRIYDDSAIEPLERFDVLLSNPGGGAALDPDRQAAAVQIRDNDAALRVVSGPEVNFGVIATGSSEERTVVLEGAGLSQSIGIEAFEFTDPTQPYRIASHDCQGTLDPGETCSVILAFEPVLDGLYETELEIANRPSAGDPLPAVLVPVRGIANRNADLAIDKSASQINALPGDSIEYELRVNNNGPVSTSNVIVEDQLPSGFSDPAILIAEGSYDYDPATRILRWNVRDGGILYDGESASLTYLVDVETGLGSLRNTATVVEQLRTDGTSINDSASVLLQVGGADLELGFRRVGFRWLDRGERFDEVSVTNLGPEDAGSDAEPFAVRIDANGPIGVAISGGEATCGGDPIFSHYVLCEVPRLTAGQTITFRASYDQVTYAEVIPSVPVDPNPTNNTQFGSVGGCAQSSVRGPVDPTLPLLVAASLFMILRRYRTRA